LVFRYIIRFKSEKYNLNEINENLTEITNIQQKFKTNTKNYIQEIFLYHSYNIHKNFKMYLKLTPLPRKQSTDCSTSSIISAKVQMALN
jgi:hypothetical protein